MASSGEAFFKNLPRKRLHPCRSDSGKMSSDPVELEILNSGWTDLRDERVEFRGSISFGGHFADCFNSFAFELAIFIVAVIPI
ncbi:MAG: hypothetical protein JWM99_2694 [Verrucomicrobiales bacterium]|nr:hypothetical protein [Verrucomicrobiales bacterium]